MCPTLVIHLDTRQASVGIWRSRRLRLFTIFANDPVGHAEFGEFLRQQAGMPLLMVVDTAEEDFRLETAPHTSFATRREIAQRKLNQFYRHSAYRAALFVGRAPDQRRDDRLLLMSLTNPDLVAPWVAAIEQAQAPLAGIYLLPVVSQPLLRLLGLRHPHLLLSTRQGSGLRQSYFSGGYLHMSRLVPLADIDARNPDRRYADETEKTRLYLTSLRMLPRDSRLRLVLPATDAEGDPCSALQPIPGVDCELIPPSRLERFCGIERALLRQYPELLHMYVLARCRPAGNLASAVQTRQYHLHRLRTGLYAAAALCFVFALGVASRNLFVAADLAHQFETAVAETRQQQQLYAEAAKHFPESALPAGDLRTAVEVAGQIRRLNRTPERLMQVVSLALEAQAELSLNRLHWRLAEAAEVPGYDGPAAEQPLARMQKGVYEVGIVDGEIRHFAGDYRAALESVSRLAESLRQNKAVIEVSILQQPVNTSSRVNLTGSTLDEQAQSLPAAPFRVRLVLGPEAAP